MRIVDAVLVDKKLNLTEDYVLTDTGDLQVVFDDENSLQTAQNRCVSELGSWLQDDNFGNDLTARCKEHGASQLTNDLAMSFISQSLKPMIEDGRVDGIESVNVSTLDSDSRLIEIVLKIGTHRGIVNFSVNNFN